MGIISKVDTGQEIFNKRMAHNIKISKIYILMDKYCKNYIEINWSIIILSV